MAKSNTETDHGKVTIYRRGMLGYQKTEARGFTFALGVPYAQYSNAIRFRYIEPRKRNWREGHQTYAPSIVVLKGWGHFDPADAFDDLGGGCSRSRHSSCAPEWQEEFDAALVSYLAKSGAEVILDGRKNDPHANGPRTFREGR